MGCYVKIETKNFCPLLQKDCIQLECSWFIKIRGMNPNTGEEIDEWDCTMKWMPMLLIENSQQQRNTGAAVESFRNEMVKNNEVGQRVLLAAAGVPPQTQTMILEG